MRRAADVIGVEYVDSIVILPNKRSCRELKTYLTRGNALIPQLIDVSDCYGFDHEECVFRVMSILKQRYVDLPLTVLYDLSTSLAILIKECVINNSGLSQLNRCVPQELSQYWDVTAALLQNVLHDEFINKICGMARNRMQMFLNSNRKIVLVGISQEDDFLRQLVEKITNSYDGAIIVCGLEQQSVNKKRTIEVLKIAERWENVPRETSDRLVQQGVFTTRADEAFGIALAVRKNFAENKSTLVVSPDPTLTRQINSQLLRWNIVADSSIGRTFSQTRAGMLLSAIINMVLTEYETSSVVDVLKMTHYETVQVEEYFRRHQLVPPNFFAAMQEFLRDQTRTIHISDELLNLVSRLQNISALSGKHTFIEWMSLCEEYIGIVDPSCLNDVRLVTRLFILNSDCLPTIECAEFSVFFQKYVAQRPVMTSTGYTPNVTILGVFEAQLMHADCIILASTTENAWTAGNKPTFWITNPMQKALKIPSSEQMQEFSRCVFERLMFKPNVLITRSIIADGAQQQPYRFFESSVDDIPDALWLHQLIYSLKQSCPRENIIFTGGCPPIENRPTQFHATEIGTLFDDPYTFYAKKILRLKPCSHINENTNVRGRYVHDVLHQFVLQSSNKKDIDSLIGVGRQILQQQWLGAAHFGIWFFRLNKIFSFFANNMHNGLRYFAEKQGYYDCEILPGYMIHLAARADRIDVNDEGNVTIVDYKTGTLPIKNEAIAGEKPQLAIEAAIAFNNGFGVGKSDVSQLSFWKLDGKHAGGAIVDIATEAESVHAIVDNTLQKLRDVIIKYNINGEAYNINIEADYNDEYKHLARVKEWRDVG